MPVFGRIIGVFGKVPNKKVAYPSGKLSAIERCSGCSVVLRVAMRSTTFRQEDFSDTLSMTTVNKGTRCSPVS
jgi:hypothetical protein